MHNTTPLPPSCAPHPFINHSAFFKYVELGWLAGLTFFSHKISLCYSDEDCIAKPPHYFAKCIAKQPPYFFKNICPLKKWTKIEISIWPPNDFKMILKWFQRKKKTFFFPKNIFFSIFATCFFDFFLLFLTEREFWKIYGLFFAIH